MRIITNPNDIAVISQNDLKLPPNLSRVPKSNQTPVHHVNAPGAKKKMLVWSDAVVATTGFGIVAKNILQSLYATGKYDIDQLAINYFGNFFDKQECPYTIVPAKLLKPEDPYGNQMLLNSLLRNNYDYLFVINDTFVVEKIAKEALPQVLANKRAAGHKIPNIVYYYPVDCTFVDQAASFFKLADRQVAYTDFAKQSTIDAIKTEPSDVIYHGTDTKIFKPVPDSERKVCRAKYLNINDDDTFLWINVNRNSHRKAIATTILAFKEFKKHVPNSKLYLHTRMQDGTGQTLPIDLTVCLRQLGLSAKDDVIFPKNYNSSSGYPAVLLNQLYNCADAYITTTLGEGWGLTVTESMAAGTPVVSGDHTSMPEILGKDDDRGYLYPCTETTFVDNSGYRPVGKLRDIVDTMLRCYNDWKDQRENSAAKQRKMIQRARAFTEQYSWENVGKIWVQLFDSLEPKATGPDALQCGEKV
jgi:glycosyltransferase involved in cell wall biosynthesis